MQRDTLDSLTEIPGTGLKFKFIDLTPLTCSGYLAILQALFLVQEVPAWQRRWQVSVPRR